MFFVKKNIFSQKEITGNLNNLGENLNKSLNAINHHQMNLLSQLDLLKVEICEYHFEVGTDCFATVSSFYPNLCRISLLTRMPDSMAPSM